MEAEGLLVTGGARLSDDFVVEYTYGGSDPGLLTGSRGNRPPGVPDGSGRRCFLSDHGPRRGALTTGGVSSSTPGKGRPESGTVRVLVDAYGRVPEDAVQTTLDTVEPG